MGPGRTALVVLRIGLWSDAGVVLGVQHVQLNIEPIIAAVIARWDAHATDAHTLARLSGADVDVSR